LGNAGWAKQTAHMIGAWDEFFSRHDNPLTTAVQKTCLP
jgi:hypothetical protein